MVKFGGVIEAPRPNGQAREEKIGAADLAAKATTFAAMVATWPDAIHVNVGGTAERIFEIVANYAWPIPLLREGEYTEMFLRSFLGDNDYVELMKTEGVDAKAATYSDITLTGMRLDGKLTWDAGKVVRPNNLIMGMLRSKADWPKLAELFDLWNRGLIDDALADAIMRFNGIADSGIRKVIAELRYEIPPMSDLIRWAVRHAFDTDIVEEFHYLDEVPTQLYALADAQGLGGKTGVKYPEGKDNKGGKLPAHEAKWFDMEWVAHWILPSTGQGYEMLHRLYDKSRFGPSPLVDKDTGFDIEHLKLLLRAQDIPPYWRDRLIAISYSCMSRRDIAGLYKTKVFAQKDVYHAYRCMGYNDENAWALTRYLDVKQNETTVAKHQRKAEQWVCKSFTLGTIGYDDAIAQLKLVGIDQQEAEASVKECVLNRSIKTAETTLKHTRVQVLKGIISFDEARKLLQAIGFTPDMVDYYLQQFRLDLTESRKHVSASEAHKLYQLGIIDDRQVFDRLVTLGYEANDATTILTLWTRELQIEQMKYQEKNAKQLQSARDKLIAKQTQLANRNAANTRRQVSEAKSSAKEAKAALKESLVGVTTKNLASWFVNGQIDEAKTRAYLVLKGWRTDVIDNWVAELKKQIEVGQTIQVSGKKPQPATEG